GYGRRPDEGRVLGNQVGAAVERSCREVAGAALDEAAPEELFRGADHQAETRGELLLRPERAQRVDRPDLLSAVRHHLPREPVPDAEDGVESRGARETEGERRRPEAHAAALPVGRERERAEGEA